MDSGQYRDPLDDVDDRIIAGRAADGDTAAFAALVRRHTQMLRAYVRRILPGTAELDDVVQETFITAWEQLPNLDDPGRVKGWLMRIAGRKAIDRIRAGRVQVDLDDVEVVAPEHAAPSKRAEMRAEVKALGDALRELPAAQRECWVLREIGGHSYEEIADELGIPLSTVRGLLARARRFLVVRMEQWR